MKDWSAVSSWLGNREAVSQDLRERRLTTYRSVWADIRRLPLAADRRRQGLAQA